MTASTVAVVGLGKIGLPLAAQFAAKGMQVIGCDINPEVVAAINSGRSHIHEEPGLAEAVATRLSGEPWWATSPQTLRELFRQAGRLDSLRPLLLAFETVVYARRSIDEPAYRAAEGAAAAIRAQRAPEEVAAA